MGGQKMWVSKGKCDAVRKVRGSPGMAAIPAYFGCLPRLISVSSIGFTGTMFELPRFEGTRTFPAIGQKGYYNA